MPRKRQQKKKQGAPAPAQKSAPAPKKKQMSKKQMDRNTKYDVTNVPQAMKSSILVQGNSVPSIPYVATLNNNAIRAFCIGFLSNTMVKGGVTRSDVPDYPLAFQFIGECLAAAVSGRNYIAGNLPFWFRNILHALQPKVVPKEMGEAAYTFVYSGTPPTLSTPSVPIGAGAYNYDFNFGLPNASSVPINGFPVCDLFAPMAYSASAGSSAFQKFSQLMNDAPVGLKKNPMNVLVPSTSPTKFLKDVSAMAISKPKQGYGSNNTSINAPGGCFLQNVQLEVPIHHPILASIGGGSDTGNRFDCFITSFGGDPTFLSGICSSILHPAEMSMKRAPRFHQIDFTEFGEVLALWVQGVQQSAASEIISPDAAVFTCPLTLQEVLLLLRNIMMQAFRETQPAVQGMAALLPATSTDNYFVPFLCAPGTCPVTTTPMLLPVPLIENIRALVYRKLHLGGPNNTGDSLYWIPILGKFVSDVLNQADYTYEATAPGSTPTTYPSFKNPASIWRRRGPNKDSEIQLLAEVAIDFVDGYSGASYVAINDPTKLNQLTELWNGWVTEAAISSHSCQLSQWSTDLGISILTSINMTRHIVHSGSLKPEVAAKVADRLWEDTRMQTVHKKSVTLSPYSTRFAIQDSCASTILSAPYDAVQGTWILPVNLVLEVTGQSTKIQRIQGYEGETYSVALTGNDVGELVSELHKRYAAKMVKGSFTQETQWDVYFKEAEKMGRGGILSSLVGGVAKSFFPNQAHIIDTVAGLVPF